MSAADLTIQELVALKPYFTKVFSEQINSGNLPADPEILQHLDLTKSLPKNFISSKGERTSLLQYLVSKVINFTNNNIPKLEVGFTNPEEVTAESALLTVMFALGSSAVIIPNLRDIIHKRDPKAVLRLTLFMFLYGIIPSIPKIIKLPDLIQDSAIAYEDPSRSNANINAELRKYMNSMPFKLAIYRNLLLNNQQIRNLYVLVAMTASHLNQHSTYEDLEHAIAASSDPTLKTILLLKQLKFLSDSSKELVLKGQSIDTHSREELLNYKFKQLRKADGKLLEDFRINLVKHYLTILEKKGDLSKTLTSIHVLANQENLFLLRNSKPNSILQEIFFGFVRHLCLVIENKNLITPETSREEINTINANNMRLFIDCLKTTQALSSKLSQKEELIEFIKKDCSEKIKNLLNDDKFSINFLTKEYKQDLIKLKFITDEKALLSLQQILELLPELKAYRIKSLDDILSRIVNGDDDFTRLTFRDNSNWWHYLSRMAFSQKASILKVAAMQRLSLLKVSPYIRDVKHNTAFAYIPKDDPNQVLSFLIPKDVNDLIGMEKTIGTLTNFFKTVIRNPSTTNHCILLHGQPGVGKTEVIKRLSKHHGFRMVMFDHGAKGDWLVGGLQSRIKSLFKEAKQQGMTCIFVDEADSSALERGNGIPNGWDPATTGNAIQQAIDQYCPNSTVVVVFATNYPNKIKQAIRSRAGLAIEMRLPNASTRKNILEHLLRNEKIANPDILQLLAMRMAGWSPRQIEKYVDSVLSSIAEHCDIIDDNIFYEHYTALVRDTFSQLNLRGVEIEVSTIQDNATAPEETAPLDETIVKECEEIRDFLDNHSKYSKLNIIQKRTLFYADSPEYNLSNSNCLVHTKRLLGQTNCIFVTINYDCDISNLIDFINQCEKVVLLIPNLNSSTQSIVEKLNKEKFPNTILAIVAISDNRSLHAHNSLFKTARLGLPNIQKRKELFTFYLNKNNYGTIDIHSDDIQQLAELSNGWSEEYITYAINNTAEKLAYTSDQSQDSFCNLIAKDIINAHAPEKKKTTSGISSFIIAILDNIHTFFYAVLVLDRIRQFLFKPGKQDLGDIAKNVLTEPGSAEKMAQSTSSVENIISYTATASMIFSTYRMAAYVCRSAKPSIDSAKKSVSANVEYYRNRLGI